MHTATVKPAPTGPITVAVTNPMPKATTITLTGTRTNTICVAQGVSISLRGWVKYTESISPGQIKIAGRDECAGGSGCSP